MYGSILIIDIFEFYRAEKIFIVIEWLKSNSMLINYLIALRVKKEIEQKNNTHFLYKS